MSSFITTLSWLLLAGPLVAAEPLHVLFLGDSGHHLPALRFSQLAPVFKDRGIALTYTEKVSDLNDENLKRFDGLMIFANHTDWQPGQEQALLEFVRSGKGFIPVHCASFCFAKSQPYIDLVGAQFRSHTTGVFRTTTVGDHEITKGCDSFSSWDETYVHHKHNGKDRTVLEVRTDGDLREPWTWVRAEGKGRVFYTAWGHDQRTWSHPGFHTLLERGTRWACGRSLNGASVYRDRPAMTGVAKDLAPFEYTPAKLPHYVSGHKLGDAIATMQKPLPAGESAKHYSVPEGFAMKPFVTEDRLGGGKPLCMTWDERGRLWLALTFDYPNELKPEGEGRDRIVICDDVDGDGACDTVTTFADKLSIPTSILRVHGGLLVHQAPHTLFLKEADGKAESRKVLFTGWGTKDTHAGPSNLRYGPDNWIYSMCGYSGFSGTVAGENHKFGQGLFRFKLASKGESVEVEKLEFLRSTSNNSWGLGFNEDGDLFGSTANGCPAVHMPIPNRYYEKVRGLNPGALPNIAFDNHIEPIVKDYRQVDWHGGFTAGAGCSVYTARSYPPEYWNKAAFICEPTAHLCAAMMLQPHGTTFTARYGWNLCAADDDWAAPIDAQVGPDGQVWIIDWYNIIVQHNPTPQGYKTGKGNAYEIEYRDQKYGRIYRMVYAKAKPEPRLNLAIANNDTLVQTLKNPNMFWRTHAQRLLVERGAKESAERIVAVAAEAAKSEEYAPAINALGTLRGLQAAGESLMPGFEQAAVSKHEPVRRAALALVLSRPETDHHRILRLMLEKDNTPTGYLHLLLAIADQPAKPGVDYAKLFTPLAGSAAVVHDPALADALLIAAVQHPDFVVQVGDAERLTPPQARLIETAIALGVRNWAAKGLTLDAVLKAYEESPPLAWAMLTRGLSNAGMAKVELNDASKAIVGKQLVALTGQPRAQLLKLAGTWGVTGLEGQLAEIAKGLAATVADPEASDADRLEAARQIVDLTPGSEDAALGIVRAAKASPKLATGLFDVLAASKAKTLGPAIAAALADLPATARPAALTILLARPESTKAFLDAVEKGTLRFDMLALDQKTALAAHPEKSISERAKKLLALGGGLPDADRQKVIDQFLPIVKRTGDAALGKKAFTQHCGKCHKHGGEGLAIGPDLTGFAVHPKEEILIHLLDPSRSVEGNYKQYTAKLEDGRVISGLLASETKTSVEILDAENKRHAIPRDDIEQLRESPKSIMPEGFEKQMTEAELVNLMEFLTRKGKWVPVPLDKVATVTSAKGMFFEPEGVAERLVLKEWKAREVNGVPFALIDPQEGKTKNVILLHGPGGKVAPSMPRSVSLPCNTPAKAIHFLSGVGGWASLTGTNDNTVCMTVRFHYAGGAAEDHDLTNGLHFADYIRRVDVKESSFAFEFQGKQQMRFLSVVPKKNETIKTIELVKGPNRTAPIVMAVTIETP
jgi:hypothetical protein